MRVKKFREILALLPASEDLKKVQEKLDDKAQKTSDFLLKIKKWGKWIATLYFMLFWAIKSILDLGLIF